MFSKHNKHYILCTMPPPSPQKNPHVSFPKQLYICPRNWESLLAPRCPRTSYYSSLLEHIFGRNFLPSFNCLRSDFCLVSPYHAYGDVTPFERLMLGTTLFGPSTSITSGMSVQLFFFPTPSVLLSRMTLDMTNVP